MRAIYEEGVDTGLLIADCLLHDIGRPEQYENPALCHAATGAKKAHAFLTKNGYSIAGEAENGKVAVDKYNETYKKISKHCGSQNATEFVGDS